MLNAITTHTHECLVYENNMHGHGKSMQVFFIHHPILFGWYSQLLLSRALPVIISRLYMQHLLPNNIPKDPILPIPTTIFSCLVLFSYPCFTISIST
jgi:hypothetical protein